MILIYSGNLYTVWSGGNGARVEIICEGGGSVFLQGDDASQFETDLDMIEGNHPDWHGDKVFGWLWDQLGYGAAAA